MATESSDREFFCGLILYWRTRIANENRLHGLYVQEEEL
jgi:hypothetical protein